jgi:hypothetical protein
MQPACGRGLSGWNIFIHSLYLRVYLSVSVDMSITAPPPKIRYIQMGPKSQNIDFSENGSKDFDQIYGDHPFNLNYRGSIVTKITREGGRTQIQNVEFVETVFTGQLDFVLFGIQQTATAYRPNSRFRYQGNLMKANRKVESCAISLERFSILVI